MIHDSLHEDKNLQMSNGRRANIFITTAQLTSYNNLRIN